MATQIQPQAGSNQFIAKDGTPLDPTAATLTRAIRQVESGGDYNAVGDGGDSKGAYQFNKGNYQKWASEYGVDPNDMSPVNQDKLAYRKVKDLLSKGYTQSEIAAMWNGSKTVNGKVEAINPEYVNKVKSHYIQLTQGYNPTPYSSPTGGTAPLATTQTQQATQPQEPENLWQKAGDVAKGIGNFLFPIVGDVYHDIKGDNKKTLLQQGGDLALSALPFIPGLGEVGEGARAAEVGVEGASWLTRFMGSSLAKGAAVGYGAGVASNLSQGQNIGQAITPGVSNLLGAGLGAAAPAVMGKLGEFATKAAGLDPQVENELRRIGVQGNPEDLNLAKQYITAAKSHATNLRATSPLETAAQNVDYAANKVQEVVDKVGADVGMAKKAAANVKLSPKGIVTTGTDFAQQVSDKYGLNLVSDENGKVTAVPIQGTMRQIAPSEVKRIENVATQLNGLYNDGGTISNVKQATDVISNINDLVDHTKDDIYGHTNDPLEALLKKTAGNINNTVRQSSPELAAVNDKYSNLKDLQDEISSMAGKKLQKGDLLMKRIFSGDKSGPVQDLFGKIQDVTGIDLQKHAALAKWAIDSYGSKADKTLLQQAIEGGIEAKNGGITSGLINLGKGAVRKTIANPTKIGLNLIKGKTPGLLSSLVQKAAIEAGSRTVR